MNANLLIVKGLISERDEAEKQFIEDFADYMRGKLKENIELASMAIALVSLECEDRL